MAESKENKQLQDSQKDGTLEKSEDQKKIDGRDLFLSGYTLKEISERLELSYDLVRKWKERYKWEDDHEIAKAINYKIRTADRGKLFEMTGDMLTRVIARIAAQADLAGDDVENVPLKTLTDALDKLRRLEMYVDNGGVQKHAHLSVNMSEDLLQDVIMRACAKVEKLYPKLSSRDLIREIFDNELKEILKKVK